MSLLKVSSFVPWEFKEFKKEADWKVFGYEWTDLGCSGGGMEIQRGHDKGSSCVYVRWGERVLDADESWCGASESRRDGGSQQKYYTACETQS